MARTARRDVIGLLIEKQVTYTEAEAEALVTRAKKLAKESGRSVRAEAELLLSRDRETRLRDLQSKVVEANKLLAAIAVEVDDLRAESGDDDGELAAIMATMATSCEPFTSVVGRHPDR
jgi:F0F1-type ATP synthase membrane subunit b/b'